MTQILAEFPLIVVPLYIPKAPFTGKQVFGNRVYETLRRKMAVVCIAALLVLFSSPKLLLKLVLCHHIFLSDITPCSFEISWDCISPFAN